MTEIGPLDLRLWTRNQIKKSMDMGPVSIKGLFRQKCMWVQPLNENVFNETGLIDLKITDLGQTDKTFFAF